MMQILTTVWGLRHLELFKKAAFKSLTQPENKKALSGSTWNIFTDLIHFDFLKDLFAKELPQVKLFLGSVEDLRDRVDNTHAAAIWQIKECLRYNQKLLLVPPDTIYGDGSVANLLKIAGDYPVSLVVPHPRVLPQILEEPYFGTNAELVTLSFKHLHRAWSEAEKGHPRQNGFVGGVVWERLDDNLYSVIHRLPTVYLAHFTIKDLRYFERMPSFGSFDHEWPSQLVQEGRQRFIASSDIAFICEVTDHEKNVPPILGGQDPNAFWRNHPHNQINNQIIATFRGASL